MLSELLAHDGVVETSHLAGPVGVMALHGGLEAGTLEMAHDLARVTGASLYSVDQPASLWWHIPSTRYEAAASAGLAAYLAHVELSVSIHGFGRPGMESTVLVGGRHRVLAARFGTALREVGVEVVDELGEIPRTLRGVHPRNPVNHSDDGGVQLELGSALRDPEQRVRLIGAIAPVIDDAVAQVVG